MKPFKPKSVHSGTVKKFHYQTEIADVGHHFVTLQLDDGREVEAAIMTSRYMPFEVGQRLWGKTAGHNLGATEQDVAMTLHNVEEIDRDQSVFARRLMQPLLGIIDMMAFGEKLGALQAKNQGKPVKEPFWGKIAHRSGLANYDAQGEFSQPPSPKKQRLKYAHTFLAAEERAIRAELEPKPVQPETAATPGRPSWKDDPTYQSRLSAISAKYTPDDFEGLKDLFRALHNGELQRQEGATAEEDLANHEKSYQEWAARRDSGMEYEGS